MGRLIEVDVDKLKDLLNDNKIELTNNIISVVRENYIPKDQYEARLKADMVIMLEDLDLQIDESAAYNLEVAKVQRSIRDKINKLKDVKDDKTNN